jgi:DNA invertase Pin-like site-specific DNA recombinase
MSPKPTSVAVYVRVSTLDQKQGVSLAMQRDACLRYVANQPGWTLVPDSEAGDDCFADVQSGLHGSKKRESYGRLLTLAHDREIDAIVVWKYDRFGRNLIEAATRSDELLQSKVRLISTMEGELKDFNLHLVFALAQQESKNISLRVSPAKRQAAEAGYWTCERPTGYQIAMIEGSARRTLTPHPDEAPVIRELFRRRAAGAGIGKLVTWLNNDEREASSDQPVLANPLIPTRHGGKWTAISIKQVLANPVYYGEVRVVEHKSKLDGRRKLERADQVHALGRHEPLISREDWDKAQAVTIARHTPGHSTLQSDHYLLTGILFCGVPGCGRKLHGHGWRADPAKQATMRLSYVCDQPHHPTARLGWLEAWVLDCVGALPLTESAIERLRAVLVQQHAGTPDRLASLQAARADLLRTMDTLTDLLIAAPTPMARQAFEKKAHALQDEMDTLERQIASLTQPSQQMDALLKPVLDLVRACSDMRVFLAAATPAERIRLVGDAITKIVYQGTDAEPEIVWHDWAALLLSANAVPLPKPDRSRSPRPRRGAIPH